MPDTPSPLAEQIHAADNAVSSSNFATIRELPRTWIWILDADAWFMVVRTTLSLIGNWYPQPFWTVQNSIDIVLLVCTLSARHRICTRRRGAAFMALVAIGFSIASMTAQIWILHILSESAATRADLFNVFVSSSIAVIILPLRTIGLLLYSACLIAFRESLA